MDAQSGALTRVLSAQENQDQPQLIIPVRLSTTSNDLDDGQQPVNIVTYALLDTGATKSCICEKLLDRINAQRWGRTKQIGIGGLRESYYRRVDLALLNNDKVQFAMFQDLEIIEYAPHEEFIERILIGMDVLGKFSEVRIKGFSLEFGSVLS